MDLGGLKGRATSGAVEIGGVVLPTQYFLTSDGTREGIFSPRQNELIFL